jgi:hypothetical protein
MYKKWKEEIVEGAGEIARRGGGTVVFDIE